MTYLLRLTFFEQSAIKSLKKLFFSNKSALLQEFKKLDFQNEGVIPMSKWCDALENVLQLNLPWRIISKNLVKLDINNNVIYNTLFDDVKSLNSNKFEGVPMMEAIYRNKINLENIFRLIDTDNSGLISLSEFTEACNFLGEQSDNIFSNEDIKSLAKSLDLNSDGYIDLNEFLEAFRLVNEPPKDYHT
ncbi:unnamed protein product [Gordionus sp. m RMFG-2023]